MCEQTNEKTKCNFKCGTCHYYLKNDDYCKEKGIEKISEYVHTDFSQCDSYLIDSKLVMF